MGERPENPSSRPRAPGPFVCVTGPSGVGKDTLIRVTRAELGTRPEFLFPRRWITRPPSDFEDHEPLSPGEFQAGVRAGLFALHWEAHGLGYAIDSSVEPALAEGRIVVCNISRAAVGAARLRFPLMKLVAITAPEPIIAGRLVERGRDDTEAVAERLQRNSTFVAAPTERIADMTIVNDGRPEEAAHSLAGFLLSLCAEPATDQPYR
jgi:ribose 1,5-bisphosphokinase